MLPGVAAHKAVADVERRPGQSQSAVLPDIVEQGPTACQVDRFNRNRSHTKPVHETKARSSMTENVVKRISYVAGVERRPGQSQ